MHLAIFNYFPAANCRERELIKIRVVYQLKLFLLEVTLRHEIETKSVDKVMLSFHTFLFQVFNVRNNF